MSPARAPLPGPRDQPRRLAALDPSALISTVFTAAGWLLVPLVPIDAIQAAAQAPSRSSRSTACLADS